MSKLITFEYPLHERSRTLLRLEHSFQQFDYHKAIDNDWETRAALSAMLDISSILARADIKSEFIKEMEKQSVNLGKMRLTQGVDSEMLEAVLLQLNTAIAQLHGVEGQLGKSIRDHEFLKSIQQRSGIPGGNCDFDLPLYYYWLQLPHEERSSQLEEWISDIQPLRQAVELLLTLIRGSSTSQHEVAENGLFNKTLDNNAVIQLIKITIPQDTQFYPEISGNKNRFNVRFIETTPLEHPKQTTNLVNFQLTICVI